MHNFSPRIENVKEFLKKKSEVAHCENWSLVAIFIM
jgi:hypothetical protein